MGNGSGQLAGGAWVSPLYWPAGRARYLTLSSRMAKQWHFALAHVQPVFTHTMREPRTRAYYLVAFRPTVMGPGERGGR